MDDEEKMRQYILFSKAICTQIDKQFGTDPKEVLAAFIHIFQMTLAAYLSAYIKPDKIDSVADEICESIKLFLKTFNMGR